MLVKKSLTQAIERMNRRKFVPIGVALVLACLVNLPALDLGLFGDDFVHRRFILDHLQGRSTHYAFWNMFDSRTSAGASSLEPGTLFGRLPWWASPDFSFALLRPLSAVSHFVDYLVWPEPWAMHLHNMALFCLVVYLAGDLYWRVFGSLGAWVALTLFAIDDTHVIATAWIASRNTLLTSLFSLLTLRLHMRVASDAKSGAVWHAPVALLCAHASSEGAVVAWAYLAAHALCLDSRPASQRIRTLSPLALVSGSWTLLGAIGGYGVRGSSIYVDPRTAPGMFARALTERIPGLLQAQFALAPEYLVSLPQRLAAAASLLSALYACVLMLAVVLLWRRSAVVRFFAIASVGAVLPQCAAGSFARLLLLSGFAAHGLIAAVIVEMGARTSRALPRAAGLMILGTCTLFIHGWVALRAPSRALAFSRAVHASVYRAAESVAVGSDTSITSFVALTFPDYLRSVFVDLYRRELIPHTSGRMDVLGTGTMPLQVLRSGRDAIELAAVGGFLLDPTTLLVRRESDRLSPGQRFDVAGLNLEVLLVTSDGRPARVRISAADLSSSHRGWLRWNAQQQRFEPFKLPALGTSLWLDVPAALSAP